MWKIVLCVFVLSVAYRAHAEGLFHNTTPPVLANSVAKQYRHPYHNCVRPIPPGRYGSDSANIQFRYDSARFEACLRDYIQLSYELKNDIETKMYNAQTEASSAGFFIP